MLGAALWIGGAIVALLIVLAMWQGIQAALLRALS